VERSRESQAMDFSIGAPMETVTLSSIGRDKTIYHEMLEEGSFFSKSENVQKNSSEKFTK
jgi:hypothetical protein